MRDESPRCEDGRRAPAAAGDAGWRRARAPPPPARCPPRRCPVLGAGGGADAPPCTLPVAFPAGAAGAPRVRVSVRVC